MIIIIQGNKNKNYPIWHLRRRRRLRPVPGPVPVSTPLSYMPGWSDLPPWVRFTSPWWIIISTVIIIIWWTLTEKQRRITTRKQKTILLKKNNINGRLTKKQMWLKTKTSSRLVPIRWIRIRSRCVPSRRGPSPTGIFLSRLLFPALSRWWSLARGRLRFWYIRIMRRRRFPLFILNSIHWSWGIFHKFIWHCLCFIGHV